MILGFSGKMGLGKTTACNMILKAIEDGEILGLETARKVGFGDMLKKEAAETYHFPLEFCYENKTAMIPLQADAPYRHEVWGETASVREILQRYGTDFIRRRDPDHWVKAFAREVERDNKTRIFLVDDMRFPNEVAFIRKYGLCFRIEPYPGYKVVSEHPTETALDGWRFDRTFRVGFGELEQIANTVVLGLKHIFG